MKVSADPPSSFPNQGSATDSKGTESKTFSKVLEEKTEARPVEEKGEGEYPVFPRAKNPGEPDTALAAAAIPAPLLLAPTPLLSREVGAPVAPNETATIQSLVHEILVATPPGGPQSVEVQFNSTTLEGLRVRVTNADGNIAIRFSTPSQSVSQLISRNMGQLLQALEEKGLPVAPIQVELRPVSVAFTADGTPSRDNRRGQGDSRQQKQQK